ncbi:transposase [Bacillus sp. EB01]|uniref:transposase n=1 Tax=Bacillus sp. EB01 TaxID=1347086 RepID=UPI0005C4793C|nr:transposase [Bacillus sp. EB01]
MPRKRRSWYPGAIFHLTSRGIRKEMLFFDEEDYLKFLCLLEKARKKYHFVLHAFCLMTNHVHLQIETINDPPWKIMQYLNSLYAAYFNKKYDYAGHVFDKRYGSELVDSVDYEVDLSRYIHRNPLKAAMVMSLEEYEWSSYRTYAGLESSPYVKTDRILGYFPEPQTANYIHYVNTPTIDLEFTESPLPSIFFL